MQHHADEIGPGSGCGRPPALPTVPGTIIILHIKTAAFTAGHADADLMTWVWLDDFVHKLLPQCFKVLPQLNHLILKTESEKQVPGICGSGSVDKTAAFLSAERDFTHLPKAPKYGVMRVFLFENEDSTLPASDEIVPNGLIIELDKFRTENYLSGE